MDSSNSKSVATGLTDGEVDALGPLALLRQSFMDGSMSPAQLSSTFDKMSSELKVYKDMAEYYQNQVTKLTHGPPPSSDAANALLAPTRPKIVPASVSLQSVVLNPPDFKAALHSRASSAERLGYHGIRFQKGGREIVLEDGRTLASCEVMNRVCKAYLESLAVVACKDCAIPLPETDMAEKFVLLCQPLSFHDQRAPEDCHEPISSVDTNILTSEDAPLEVLLDLWEHAVVFCCGSFALGGRLTESASSTPSSHSSASSPGATSPNAQNAAPSSSTRSASAASQAPMLSDITAFSTLNSSADPSTPLSMAIADSGTTYQSIFGAFGFGTAGGTAPSNQALPATPTGTIASMQSSSLVDSLTSIFSANCEKLMRVIIFRREAHVQEKFAERLVRCLMGTSVHYRNVNKLGAASSLLMIAHQVIAMFPSVIPPVTSDRIYVLLLLGASTEHERNEWLHMLHDQIHFTTSILLSFNVGFIVSKLRTNPVLTKPVWEEIATRLTELENLLPTLKSDMPLFQVWVKILIACFHGEIGARCGDMDRAALSLSRVEQLVIEHYSSSLAIVLLAELRNFAQHCSPCSVVLNGKEQVLCHYVIDRIQAIHDEMSASAEADDLSCGGSKMDETPTAAHNTGSSAPPLGGKPTVSASQFDYTNSRAPEGSATVAATSSSSSPSEDTFRATTPSGRPLNFVPNNAPAVPSRPVPHVHISSQQQKAAEIPESDESTMEAFRSTADQARSDSAMDQSDSDQVQPILTPLVSGMPSYHRNASPHAATSQASLHSGRLPPITSNPNNQSPPTPSPTMPPFEAAVNGFEPISDDQTSIEGQAFSDPVSAASSSTGPLSFESDWDYAKSAGDPDVLLSNWSASHNRLGAELFGFADADELDSDGLPS